MISSYFHNLAESVVIISLFCILYLTVFQQEASFKQNRLFLVTGLILSLIMPFIDFSYPASLPNITSINLSSITIYADKLVHVGEEVTYNISDILQIIYLLMLSIFVIRFIYQSIKISTFFRNARIDEQNGVKIVYTNKEHSAFSFLKFVFIDKSTEHSKDLDVVINHEIAHIAQKHSIDLILFEILLIMQWFNPIVWIYGKKIKENHEYLVDNTLIKNGVNTRNYQQILLNTYEYFNYDLINNFNHSLTLKRLLMMTKNKSQKKAIVKLIAIIPVLLISVYLVSCSAGDKEVGSAKKVESEEVVTLDESNKKASVETTDTLEKDEIFMVVEKMPEFEGGDKALRKYISSNVEYPKEAKEKGIEGKVYIRFVVTDKGDVDNVTVMRSIDPLLDNEAVRVVKSLPKWKPGKQRGQAVNVYYTVPINFKLQ